jgi:hypothetical protein
VNEPRAERPYMPGYGILGPPRGKVCCRSRGLKSASPHPRLLGDDVGAGRPHGTSCRYGGDLARGRAVVQRQPRISEDPQPPRRP